LLPTIVAAMILVTRVCAEVFTGEDRNDQFTIHARLNCYNGSANLRIWVIGSRRMLYIADDSPASQRINKYLSDGGGWFDRDIYADFIVEPLAPDIPRPHAPCAGRGGEACHNHKRWQTHRSKKGVVIVFPKGSLDL
jgi:hypothetical protein